MKAIRQVKKLKLPTSYTFALSMQGDRLAVIGRNVVMTNPVLLTRLYSCHPISHPSYAAFSPDGATLAVKSTSGEIVLLEVDSGEIIFNFRNKTDGEGPTVAFSVCGKYLVDACWNGQIIVRDAFHQVPDLRHTFDGEMIVDVLPSADRSTWAFIHQPKATSKKEFSKLPYVTVWKWPLIDYRVLSSEIRINSSALSPDGNVVAITGESVLHFLSTERGTILKSVPVERCKRIRWSPDGTLIALVLQSSISVHTFPSFEVVNVFEQEDASDVCFAPDQSFIALGGWTGGIVRPFSEALNGADCATGPA